MCLGPESELIPKENQHQPSLPMAGWRQPSSSPYSKVGHPPPPPSGPSGTSEFWDLLLGNFFMFKNLLLAHEKVKPVGKNWNAKNFLGLLMVDL
jgi:hypothetical protein